MIRSDRFCAGRLLFCLWIPFLFYTVAECREYDKCTTEDGRQGVCTVKKYCREASQHELLLCEGDEENHCCPLPTTQRSAPTLAPFEKPRDKDPYKPEPEVKRINTDPFQDSNRDEQLKKPPVQDERRYIPQSRPVVPPYEPDRRDPVIRQPDRDRGIRQPERDPQVRQPNRDRGVRQPENYPIRQPESYPVRAPNIVNVGRPPDRDHGGRPPNRDLGGRPPNRDYGGRPPQRPTSTPRWISYDSRPERKNRTLVDTSKFPITFPETYEHSVPRPKVPACGVKPYDLLIAGGQESGKHEWPWMTAIFRRYPDSRPKTFLCGGSLINTKYVLTAAHCFVNNYVILPASSFVVRLGSHYLDSGEEYTVSNLVIHHNHSGSDFFNDIALVRLASEVYITDKIAPICLPPPDMIRQTLVGKVATVAGWGDTAFRTSGTRILQHVAVPVVSGEECFAAYSRVRGAAFLARGSDHVICAGLREGGKDACLGDSGGPLMIPMPDSRWVIVGIVSLGYKCAEPGYPGVYTRVTHYMSWINTNMKRY